MIHVTTFPDAAVDVIQGLKTRFEAAGGAFAGTRISVLKDDNAHDFEIIVRATGGQELNNGTTKNVPLTLLLFAPDYSSANKLAEKTTEYLKSLPALRSSIHWIEILNAGEHIENSGPQQLRNVTALAKQRASQTIAY